MIETCHVRHIFMPVDQTNKKLFISCNNLLNVKVSCCLTNLSSQAPPFITLSCSSGTTCQPMTESLPQHTSCLSGKMARPTQQKFLASIGSFHKPGPYLSHFYYGEERLLRSNSSERGVIKIPLIVPPVSH